MNNPIHALPLHGEGEKLDPWATRFAIVAASLTLARLIVLLLAQHELGPDETQYWFWSQTPALGYYSKPPLIAWVIGFTTHIFGDSAFAIRLATPLALSGVSLFLFLIGARLFKPEIGFWAGVTWLLLPGVSVSSTLMSTDPLLLFFWSGALYAFLVMITSARTATPIGFAVILGGLVGMGLLAKYAAIYFPLAVGAATLMVMRQKEKYNLRPLSWQEATIASISAIIVLAPNLIWNARNDFQTVSHTADNTNWGADLFHPIELLEFIGAQFGVAGPLIFPAFLVATVLIWRHGVADQNHALARLLTFFSIPILIIICLQALLSRAHANWAAAAYPAACLFVCIYAADWQNTRSHHFSLAIKGSIGLHAVIALVCSLAVISPGFADNIGLSSVFKRLRGWETQGAHIAQTFDAGNFDVIMAGDREILGGLIYYARNADEGRVRFVGWNSNQRIDHHFEAYHHFDPATESRALYVTTSSQAIQLINRFGTINLIDTLTVQLDAKNSRTLYLFDVSDFQNMG